MNSPGKMDRLRISAGVLAGIRGKEMRSARRLVSYRYGNLPLPERTSKFLSWSRDVIWNAVPGAQEYARIDPSVSRRPYWQAGINPLANHPWSSNPDAALPESVDVVTVGAGLGGAAVAYHWGQAGEGEMIVLEKDDAASGAAGRNAGMLVRAGGSYHGYYVYEPVLNYLAQTHPDLEEAERETIAEEFADAYVVALDASHEMIRETIKREGIDCEYQQSGLVVHSDEIDRPRMEASLSLAAKLGWSDYSMLSQDEIHRRVGLVTNLPGALSSRGATWHPAKWVWGVLRAALETERVRFFSRTKVLRVTRESEGFTVVTTRGPVRARHVINATEAYTASIFQEYLTPYPELILPYRSQAMYADGGPDSMVPGVGVLGPLGWFHPRADGGFLFGSDHTRVPLSQTADNNPSRFITHFMSSEARRLWRPQPFNVTREWTGTSGQAADKFPVVGQLDSPGLWTLGGFAGAGSAVAFSAGLHLVNSIQNRTNRPDHYPARFFAPDRFRSPASYVRP